VTLPRPCPHRPTPLERFGSREQPPGKDVPDDFQERNLASGALPLDNLGAIDYPGWPLLIGMTLASLLFGSLWHR
jgi:hypothetical protein